VSPPHTEPATEVVVQELPTDSKPFAVPKRGPRWRRVLVISILGFFALLLALVLSAVGYVLSLPSVSDAPARVTALLESHHGQQGHLPLPTKLADAIVAVEDEHFYSNVFVNVFDGAANAGVTAIRQGGDPGGSTIAQQLAKQLYPHNGGVGGTLEQIGLGVKLSLSYTKPQILSMYLNAVYFGHGFWGATTAAEGYFGVNPYQLTWGQAAMLAGLPQAPSAYDPLKHPSLAKERQREVLDQLVVNHFLTRSQSDAAYRSDLGLR
jgi:penicillin-binding protein 1A